MVNLRCKNSEPLMSELGQFLLLPRRNMVGCFSSISGHYVVQSPEAGHSASRAGSGRSGPAFRSRAGRNRGSIRLEADAARAHLRADRAEQRLVRNRREIESHLMPSFGVIHGPWCKSVPMRWPTDTRGSVRFLSAAAVHRLDLRRDEVRPVARPRLIHLAGHRRLEHANATLRNGKMSAIMETAMPNSLQYPLERRRDLQRRWQRLMSLLPD